MSYRISDAEEFERIHMEEIREKNCAWEERQKIKDEHREAYLEKHPEAKESFEWDIITATRIRKDISEQEERFKKYEAEKSSI